MNIELALQVTRNLVAAGVREICLCAGARNSPLVEVISSAGLLRKYHFFEERSAAFFALGRIKAEGRPVAVITTSGTAVAELLPATIEAHYTGLPLILVTADRPVRYRGTGAPQAIEQAGIFGDYVWHSSDIETLDHARSTVLSQRTGPQHWNVCFEEPLLDRTFTAEELRLEGKPPSPVPAADLSEKTADLMRFLAGLSQPLLVVGALEAKARNGVEGFLLSLGAPVYCEASSGLRERESLRGLRISSTDRVFEFLRKMKKPVDGVLRIGGVPTCRFWRDLEVKRADLPVLSVSDVPFAGLTRSKLMSVSLEAFFGSVRAERKSVPDDFDDLLRRDGILAKGLQELYRSEPRSEPGMVHAFSKAIARGSRVYLGNSLPIREWDLAATREARDFEIGANRGANGIDGQVSSFLGFARAGVQNWSLVGDLTALYDLSAPWILPQMQDRIAGITVMNNGGGRIFSRMFENPAFQNQHALELSHWAGLWGIPYSLHEEIPSTLTLEKTALLELRPDPAATERFWKAHDRLCQQS